MVAFLRGAVDRLVPAVLVGLAERLAREGRGNDVGVRGGAIAWLRENLGGAEIFFCGVPSLLLDVWMSLGSRSARIQGVTPYSSDSRKACSGEIQTLPAVASGLVAARDLT